MEPQLIAVYLKSIKPVLIVSLNHHKPLVALVFRPNDEGSAC